MNYSLFIDYENIFHEIHNNSSEEENDAHDMALEVVERTLRMLQGDDSRVLLARAYADWENLGRYGIQGSLALLSVKPEYVLAKRGKSSADLELSLSALEVLLTRDDIEGFVILGGDRDYIPVVSRIRESGKRVRVVGFSRSTSGDLIGIVGTDNFTDAAKMLPHGSLYGASANSVATSSTNSSTGALNGQQQNGNKVGAGQAPSSGGGGMVNNIDLLANDGFVSEPAEEDLLRCLKLIMVASSKLGKEVWLGPFLKNFMNEEFAAFNNAQRKSIIQTLREREMIKVETRSGSHIGGTYSVVLLNMEHPQVAALYGGSKLESGGVEVGGMAEIDVEQAGLNCVDGLGDCSIQVEVDVDDLDLRRAILLLDQAN